MAFCQDFPGSPNGIESDGLQRTRFAMARDRIPQHPFHGMRLPECMDASLVRALSVVVARGVQRHVGIGQVVSQVGSCAHDLRWLRGCAVRRSPSAHQSPIRSLQCPWQGAEARRRQQPRVWGQEGRDLIPCRSCQGFSIEGQVVHVQVMPDGLQTVGVLSSIRTGGSLNQKVRVVAPGFLA